MVLSHLISVVLYSQIIPLFKFTNKSCFSCNILDAQIQKDYIKTELCHAFQFSFPVLVLTELTPDARVILLNSSFQTQKYSIKDLLSLQSVLHCKIILCSLEWGTFPVVSRLSVFLSSWLNSAFNTVAMQTQHRGQNSNFICFKSCKMYCHFYYCSKNCWKLQGKLVVLQWKMST